MTLRGLALFAGIGGLERGVELNTTLHEYRLRAVVEIDPVCRAIIAKSRACLVIHNDVRTFHPQRGEYDFVSGGFPCQPFSTASRGRKTAVDLWPEMRRVIDEGEPSFVFAENVQREAIEGAARDLVERGFIAAVAPVSSSQVGAPDDRRRWWLLAHHHDARESAVALHAEVAGVPPPANPQWRKTPPRGLLGVGAGSFVGGKRGSRLKRLGNAVNPYQASAAFRMLLDVLVKGR